MRRLNNDVVSTFEVSRDDQIADTMLSGVKRGVELLTDQLSQVDVELHSQLIVSERIVRSVGDFKDHSMIVAVVIRKLI